MSETQVQTKPGQLIAPLLHTGIMVGLFLLLGVAGFAAYQGSPSATSEHPDVVPLYASTLLAEWGLVYFVWRGIRKKGVRLGDLVGRWNSARAVAIDLLVGLAAGLLWPAAEALIDHWLPNAAAKSVESLLPQSPTEIILWVALSVSAGFCEEVTFRGYLQRQFTAITRSGILAVVLQAAVFGFAHAYQGLAAVESITAFGLFAGGLALWRKNLRPGIVMHAWTDLFAGLLARFFQVS